MNFVVFTAFQFTAVILLLQIFCLMIDFKFEQFRYALSQIELPFFSIPAFFRMTHNLHKTDSHFGNNKIIENLDAIRCKSEIKI